MMLGYLRTGTIVSLLLIFAIGFASTSNAQIQNPITVTTDKSSYSEGEIVRITGQVRDLYPGTPVSLIVLSPSGGIVALAQVTVGADKKFSTEITAGETMRTAGIYTVNITYGTQNRSATTSFEFGDGGSDKTFGEILWLETNYSASGTGVVRVNDQDMNLDPEGVDNFDIKVWSDSDSRGIDLTVSETNKATGIFEGTVFFTTLYESGGHRLQVSEGDAITAEYTDHTPFNDVYETVILTTTAHIRDNSSHISDISFTNPRVVDAFGNPLSSIETTQQVQFSADLVNKNNLKQDFTYYFKIRETGKDAWITGSISPGQSLSPSLSWIPTTGTYIVDISLFDNIQNKNKLAESLTIKIIVEGEEPQHYIDRYYNEEKYKEWFDENYPQYSSIFQAVGVYEIISPEHKCGSGTIFDEKSNTCLLEDSIPLESETRIKIIGLSNHYSISEPIEIQVIVSDSSFRCGDLYVTIYHLDRIDVITQRGYFDQCFENNQLLPIKDEFSVGVDSSGYYEIVVEMVSKALKTISTKEKFAVGDVPEIIYSKDNTVSPAPESEIPKSTGSFDTAIINPKSVKNWEFYDINTECQLKYLFFKDPSSAYSIISVMEQNAQLIQQEYFARGGQQVEYGDRVGLTSSHELIREISGEILMGEFSINPVLKNKMSLVMTENTPDYALSIQQGTHECEEEFRLYSDDDTKELAITKTPFTNTPINGIEVGQWVKFTLDVNISSEGIMEQIENPFTSQLFGGVNFDVDDIEEMRLEVTDISGNQISMENKAKIKGKTSLFEVTNIQTFPNPNYLFSFIPINVQQGDILSTGIEGVPDSYVIDFPTKKYGGKQTETIHVGKSFEKNYQGMGSLKIKEDTFFHKKTGMFLETKTSLNGHIQSSSVEFEFSAKAIDYYIPSEDLVANIPKGGGCLIATATYGSELAPQVQKLREIRDNSLLQTESGTNFMGTFNDFYYSFSPVIADYERENPVFKEMVKVAITPMITSLSLMEYADSESSVLGYGISLIVLNGMMYVGIPIAGIIVIRKRFQTLNP